MPIIMFYLTYTLINPSNKQIRGHYVLYNIWTISNTLSRKRFIIRNGTLMSTNLAVENEMKSLYDSSEHNNYVCAYLFESLDVWGINRVTILLKSACCPHHSLMISMGATCFCILSSLIYHTYNIEIHPHFRWPFSLFVKEAIVTKHIALSNCTNTLIFRTRSKPLRRESLSTVVENHQDLNCALSCLCILVST